MPTKEEIEAAAREEAEGAKFEERFNAMFHKASTDREKRFKKDLLKDMDTSMSTKMDELKELISAGAKGGEPAPGGKPGDQKPGDPGAGGKLSAEAEALIRQAQKDALEAKNMAEKWKKDAEAEKARGRQAEERQQLTSMLTGKVKPTMLDMVVEHLHKNIIRDDESGAILWKGADGETLPLKDGVATWAKSDVGKEYAPPIDRKGNGSRSPGEAGGPVKPGDMTMDVLGGIIEGSMIGR